MLNLKILIENAYIKILIVTLSIAIVGIVNVSNYGISTDELFGINQVYWNRDLITQGKPIQGIFKYDGTAFNFASEAAFQVYKHIRFDREQFNKKLQNPQDKFLEKIKFKHFFTFITSLISYISVAVIVGIFCGFEYGWLGSIILVLFPRFWGHSFFNFKDIPFASIFILSTLIGAYLIKEYIALNKNKSFFQQKRIILFSNLYGILIGILTGMRFGGFILLLFFLAAYILTRGFKKSDLFRDYYNFILGYFLIAISWLLTTIICYPVSWSNPLKFIFEIIHVLSKYGWAGTVLFDGQFISAQNLPWSYIPTWVIITTPLIFQVSFVGGIGVILIKYRQLSSLQRACLILLLFQVFFLPLIAIVKGSTVYDGIRHFLFILPVFAVFSTILLVWIYQKINSQKVKLFYLGIMIVFALKIILNMVTLHPYEYIYFNQIVGGLYGANNLYETEYWGLSMREAIEWINQKAKPNEQVIIAGPLHSAQAFARPDLKLIPHDKKEKGNLIKPYYYLARPRWDLPKQFPECKVTYQVLRQDVSLTTVKKCN